MAASAVVAAHAPNPLEFSAARGRVHGAPGAGPRGRGAAARATPQFAPPPRHPQPQAAPHRACLRLSVRLRTTPSNGQAPKPKTHNSENITVSRKASQLSPLF